MKGTTLGTGNERIPLGGCVLIGGRSLRMGRPKHLIEENGVTWLERVLEKLRRRVSQVVIAGQGYVPANLAGVPVVEDVEGIAGPLAGVLAVMRHYPGRDWLVIACDLPLLQLEALDWLLSFRGSATAAVLPDLAGDGKVEPLLAYYAGICRAHLEHIAGKPDARLSDLAGYPAVITPRPPADLQRSWLNINTPDQLAAI